MEPFLNPLFSQQGSAFWLFLAAFGFRADQTPVGLSHLTFVRGKYPGVVSQHAENRMRPSWGKPDRLADRPRIWPSADWFLLAEARCRLHRWGHRWPEPRLVRNRRARHCDGAPGDGVVGERTLGVRGGVGVPSARPASKVIASTPRARPSARVPTATGTPPHPASSIGGAGRGREKSSATRGRGRTGSLVGIVPRRRRE